MAENLKYDLEEELLMAKWLKILKYMYSVEEELLMRAKWQRIRNIVWKRKLLKAKWHKSYKKVERRITEGQVVDNLK